MDEKQVLRDNLTNWISTLKKPGSLSPSADVRSMRALEIIALQLIELNAKVDEVLKQSRPGS